MKHSSSITDLSKLVLKFRADRDWQQFHNPKDMALSLVLEASECLELTQWRNGAELEKYLRANKQRVGEELSDVLGWILLLANDLEIDLPDAFRRKIKHNEEKYPIDKARGSAKKYTEYK
jgi:dCTP diphosphatase